MSKVEIANPKPGGSNVTSLKQAEKYIREGRAIVTERGKLFFLSKYSRISNIGFSEKGVRIPKKYGIERRTYKVEGAHKVLSDWLRERPEELSKYGCATGSFCEVTINDSFGPNFPQPLRKKKYVKK